MYSVPDKAEIFVNNVLTTRTNGFVSGSGSLNLNSVTLQTGDQVKVVITGNDPATRWDYNVYYSGGIVPTTYTVGTTGAVTGTIANDDATITLAVSPSSVLEDGTTNLVYTFTRTGITTNALTVNYSITGTADSSDYTGATPGTGKTITFAAGASTATLTIDPTADTIVESDETVALTLVAGTGYTVGTTAAVTGTITIANDNDSFTTTPQKDIIDAQDGDDTITSILGNLQQNDTINGGNGTDTLIITGGTVNDLISIDTSNTTNQLDIPGTTVFGFERFDLTTFTGTISFDGTTGNDWIKAGTGNDDLTSGDGNDTLNGGAGADLLIGGKGNDTYVVDNVGDVIAEGLNQGIDTVESSITWTLKANLENLTLQGTTAINGIGNNLNNSITGNTGNNVLNGGLGNDTLIGDLGNDTLIGDLGNDSYYVDNTADRITELVGQGTDSVFSTAATYTLSANVENLTLEGTTAINGTGNTLNNIITGNTADNVLTGGTGADTLIGGAGNDSYYVDNTADSITENANEGTDSVFTTVTYTLTTNTENLTLQGTTAINGTGNELNNIITGNTANNQLNGGTGADTLIGGAGNDSYYVDNTADIITELVSQGTDIVFTTVTYTL
ncbi:beta strand repeat-containing protein, partial [Dolichospermum planctonicum]|uniref:beta strand repeat-containing protein n=1 Tax=Dolichospermum planctonicum TaxID=136072 RepID=UPI0010F63989